MRWKTSSRARILASQYALRELYQRISRINQLIQPLSEQILVLRRYRMESHVAFGSFAGS